MAFASIRLYYYDWWCLTRVRVGIIHILISVDFWIWLWLICCLCYWSRIVYVGGVVFFNKFVMVFHRLVRDLATWISIIFGWNYGACLQHDLFNYYYIYGFLVVEFAYFTTLGDKNGLSLICFKCREFYFSLLWKEVFYFPCCLEPFLLPPYLQLESCFSFWFVYEYESWFIITI